MEKTVSIEKTKSMRGVDIAKFFFALCVVALHSGALEPLRNVGNIYIYIFGERHIAASRTVLLFLFRFFLRE